MTIRLSRVHAQRVLLLAICTAIAAPSNSKAQTVPRFVECDVTINGTGVLPNAVAAGDFDGDGNPDLAVVSGSTDQVFVGLTNRAAFQMADCVGGTNFGEAIAVSHAPVGIAAGDIEPNGTVDLVVTTQAGASILRNMGNGMFMAEAPLPASSVPTAVVIADLDSDGLTDIVVGNAGGGANAVSILYGKVGGGFEDVVTMSVGSNGPVTAVLVQDLNNDFFPDIGAVTTLGKVVVFLQRGAAPRTFDPLQSISAGTRLNSILTGDFDGNGKVDFAVTDGSSDELTILLNRLPATSNPLFAVSSSVPTGANPSGAGLSTRPTTYVAVASQTDSTVGFFRRNADGTLAEVLGNCLNVGSQDRCSVGKAPRALVLADIDGDGKSDVITANNDNTASISILLSSDLAKTPTITPTPGATDTVTKTPLPTVTPTPTVTSSTTPTISLTPTFTLTPVATPTISDCCRAHFPTPGCQEPPGCSAAICGADPNCCSPQGGWDQQCVDRARERNDVCMCPPFTPTPTDTSTATATPSATGTHTPTETPSSTPTSTGPTPFPTRTPTPTLTVTGTIPPTFTATITSTITLTPTPTPTMTASPTLSRTPSRSPTPGTTLLAPGLSIQGESCAIVAGADSTGIGLWLLPPLVVWLRRRLR